MACDYCWTCLDDVLEFIEDSNSADRDKILMTVMLDKSGPATLLDELKFKLIMKAYRELSLEQLEQKLES